MRRFDYQSHRCSALYDPDSFPCCENVPASGAEALNRQWKASRMHIRFLGKQNLDTFIFIRMLFLNLRALVRDAGGAVEPEDQCLYEFANKRMKCDCLRCSLLRNLLHFAIFLALAGILWSVWTIYIM